MNSKIKNLNSTAASTIIIFCKQEMERLDEFELLEFKVI